jgi:sugar phosphate isomerase/epimerase
VSLQNFEKKNQKIKQEFLKLKKSEPDRFKKKINLSWSNWGFGIEPLEVSARRLQKSGIRFIELHGNRYGKDLGYNSKEVKKVLSGSGTKVAGICGMFSPDNDLSSNRGIVRQSAIDYIRRQLELAVEVGATYLLVVPGAVGRPAPIDGQEFFRSVESIKIVADEFIKSGIRAAVEPIRSAEVSLCHTFDDALKYIKAVNHPGVQHMNGDLYHMLVEESHIAHTIYSKGERLTNLHMADTNRCALGDGSLDLDTIIMALYLIGYNNDRCFATPEPLGPGGDPYPAMFGKPDSAKLNELVSKTARYWNEREAYVLSL